jgi:hypothetical protein
MNLSRSGLCAVGRSSESRASTRAAWRPGEKMCGGEARETTKPLKMVSKDDRHHVRVDAVGPWPADVDALGGGGGLGTGSRHGYGARAWR